MASQQSPVPSLKRSQDSTNDNASRKRQRTSASSPPPTSSNPITPEERREARAHRNRIAAQNSRDRRKAQFAFLERRVAELEEENRMLRAGIAVPHVLTPSPADLEKEKARERENEELRERIKTLEKGWDAVLKALAAQGLATQPSPPESTQPQVTEPAPAQPVFPLSPASTQSSLDFDLDLSLPSAFSPDPSPLPTELQQSPEPTRHLAAGGLETLCTPSQNDNGVPIDESAMDSLFREIICAPTSPSFGQEELHLSSDDSPASQSPLPAMSTVGMAGEGMETVMMGDGRSEEPWMVQEEMQKILDMLPIALDGAPQPDFCLDFKEDRVEGGSLWESVGVF